MIATIQWASHSNSDLYLIERIEYLLLLMIILLLINLLFMLIHLSLLGVVICYYYYIIVVIIIIVIIIIIIIVAIIIIYIIIINIIIYFIMWLFENFALIKKVFALSLSPRESTATNLSLKNLGDISLLKWLLRKIIKLILLKDKLTDNV